MKICDKLRWELDSQTSTRRGVAETVGEDGEWGWEGSVKAIPRGQPQAQ